MKDSFDKYLAKCTKRLKEWGAPLTDWTCVSLYDAAKDEDMVSYEVCELCGCQQVRFVHVMSHPDFYETISVGCVCAGIMEGDLCAAKDRERNLKNRLNRRKSYMKKQWKEVRPGQYYLLYKGNKLIIYQQYGRFKVQGAEQFVTSYHTGFHDAKLTAFDLVDPEERI